MQPVYAATHLVFRDRGLELSARGSRGTFCTCSATWPPNPPISNVIGRLWSCGWPDSCLTYGAAIPAF